MCLWSTFHIKTITEVLLPSKISEGRERKEALKKIPREVITENISINLEIHEAIADHEQTQSNPH
jgi:hypothetical protein